MKHVGGCFGLNKGMSLGASSNNLFKNLWACLLKKKEIRELGAWVRFRLVMGLPMGLMHMGKNKYDLKRF